MDISKKYIPTFQINKNLSDEPATASHSMHKRSSASNTDAHLQSEEAQRMRLNNDGNNKSLKAEARMRLHEAAYQSIENPSSTSTSSTIRVAQKKAAPSHYVTNKKSAAISERVYDASKNPFDADDGDDNNTVVAGQRLVKKASSLNPFGDVEDDVKYSDTTNPFQ